MPLDYEAVASHMYGLLVTVSDLGNPAMSTSCSVTINIRVRSQQRERSKDCISDVTLRHSTIYKYVFIMPTMLCNIFITVRERLAELVFLPLVQPPPFSLCPSLSSSSPFSLSPSLHPYLSRTSTTKLQVSVRLSIPAV